MKKNILSSLVILFCFPLAFSQSNSIEVIYKQKMIKNPIDTAGVKPGDYKLIMFEEMESVKNVLTNVEYLLKANQNEAVFSYQDFMENDANPTMMNAILASSADGKFYNNITEEKYFWQTQTYEGEYYRIITSDKNDEWKISAETKKIGEFICRKATKEILLNNRLPIEVTAWFSPEIPFPFGPKGYGGLPGLIIALDERGFYFYADKIRINDKNIEINKPGRGQLVSPAKYDQLTKIN